jgi:5'-3' exonuclease
MQEEENRVVLLIDLSSLFWSAWHSSGEDEISAARRRTLDAVQRCIGDSTHRLIAICCDSGRSFRKDIDEQYKANRPEKDHATIGELDRVKQELRDQGYRLWEAKGFEADDVIATACAAAVKLGHPVVVASADKDLLQLLRYDGVKVLRTHNWTTTDRNGVEMLFGVQPEALGDWLALVGDSSDNVRGVPGVGPKTATSLLAKHKSIAGILECLERKPADTATPAVTRALQQNVETLGLARKLVELRTDAPIEFGEIFEPLARKSDSKTEEEKDMDAPDPQYVDPQTTNGVTPQISPPAAAVDSKASAERGELVAPRAASVVPFTLGLEPQSLGIAFKLAGALWESRLYSRFPSEQAIAAVIIRGRELGLGALTALDVFHVVEGKPAPHAHFIVSLAEQHEDCEYFMQISSDNEHAEYETKNRKHPKPIRHRYTVNDAVDAGLCRLEIEARDWGAKDGKDHRGNWDKRRAEMLRKTCAVQLVRIAYPYAALGLYSISELGGNE